MNLLKATTRAAILILALVCTDVQAGFEQFSDPKGSVNTFDNNLGAPGNWLWWSEWGVPDLQAITSDNRTFELAPNISAFSGAVASGIQFEINYWTDSPDGGVTPGNDGNKWLDASCFYEIGSMTNGEKSATFSFDVTDFDLDSRYTLTGFIKVIEPWGDYLTITNDEVTIVSTGSHTLSVDLENFQGRILQAGWHMEGLNANPDTDWGSVMVTATDLAADVGDLQAPNPDPMSFAVAPYALNDHEISMTATTATDDAGVEYYFTCTAGGGNNSDWQSSPTYVDSGLTPGSEYTYEVKARDLSVDQNETDPSPSASATTDPEDLIPPTPNPMTFASMPDVSPVSIMLTATPATDSSEVEYYFTCTSGDGNNSGWQSSPVYVDTGLVPGSNYSYTVVARDTSLAMNSTTSSVPVDVTTHFADQFMVNSLTNYVGNTTEAMTIHILAKAGLETGSVNEAPVIEFDTSGAVFSEGIGFEGRDVLRTIAQNFEDTSFEAYATYIFDATWDQAAFIGMGQGVITGVPGNWGVPELQLTGINGIVGEFKSILSAGAPNCNILRIDDGSITTNDLSAPVSTNDVFRVKLAYDAQAEMATISIDTNYLGGAFEADLILGEYSTTNMWAGSPVRVYAGGGEGTVVRDLVIRAETVVVPDLTITHAGTGAELTWQGSPGQTYDVMHKSSLMTGSWIADPTPGCTDIYTDSAGMLSVTSTVSGVQVYYQVIAK